VTPLRIHVARTVLGVVSIYDHSTVVEATRLELPFLFIFFVYLFLLLNNRPRKRHGYLSPLTIHQKLTNERKVALVC
jgi:hypothetical protein